MPNYLVYSFILVLLLVLKLQVGVAIQCVSCASPLLMQNWHSTGFPTLTDFNNSVVFTDRCDNLKNTEFLKDCPNVCIEMLLVVAGQYAILRGCHQTLLGSYRSDVSMAGDVECNIGNSFQNANIDGKTISRALQGVRFCRTDSCNMHLEVAEKFSASQNWDTNCKMMQTSDCVSCLRFDNEGDCHPDSRETCQGAWCTKNIGYLNGREVEMRGCSSINPLSTTMCVKLDVDHVFTPMSDKSLHQKYTVDQCFCQGSKCNGASGLGVYHLIWPLVLFVFIMSVAAKDFINFC